ELASSPCECLPPLDSRSSPLARAARACRARIGRCQRRANPQRPSARRRSRAPEPQPCKEPTVLVAATSACWYYIAIPGGLVCLFCFFYVAKAFFRKGMPGTLIGSPFFLYVASPY